MSRICLPLSVTTALMASTALADVPAVAADIAPVHALVARVMAGVGAPTLVIPPGASPHEYNLRPSEAAAIQDADLVFWIGADLTPWMTDAIATLAVDATVTALLEAEGTERLAFREGALFEAHVHDAAHDGGGHEHDHDHDEDHVDHDHDHDHADHAHEEHAHDDHAHDAHSGEDHDDRAQAHAGHDHGAHDPHGWLSIANAVHWLDLIAAELSVADPENAGTYFINAAEAKGEMERLSEEVAALLAPARGRNFIVFHDGYQYFERSFDFPASGAISLSDAREPSPARIAEVQDHIRDAGIDCVLAEPQFNPAMVDTVLDGVDANAGVIDPLGAALTPGADLYPELIRAMGRTLAECLTSGR